MFHLSSSAAAAPVDEREAAAAQYMPSRADVLAARWHSGSMPGGGGSCRMAQLGCDKPIGQMTGLKVCL